MAGEAVAHERAGRGLVIAVVAGSTFMTSLDTAVVNLALPTIRRQFEVSLGDLEWISGAYLLALTGFILIAGRLADALGRRRLFLTGVSGFAVASLMAGFANSIGMLIAVRAAQGVMAALVIPTALAIIGASFAEGEERRRDMAIGAWLAIATLAVALGPVIGGAISEYADWRWIFFINVPVAAVVVTVGLFVLQESTGSRFWRMSDVASILLAATAFFAVTLILIEWRHIGWASARAYTVLAVALLAPALLVIVRGRAGGPILDLPVTDRWAFAGGLIVNILCHTGLLGVYFYVSLFLQQKLRYSPVKASAGFVAFAVVMAGVSPAAAALASRIGAHRTVGVGLTLMATGMFLQGAVGGSIEFLEVIMIFVVVGIGYALVTPVSGCIIAAVPRGRYATASSVIDATREASGLLGITIIGAILNSSQGDFSVNGYRRGIIVAGGVLLAGAVVGRLTLPGAARRQRP